MVVLVINCKCQDLIAHPSQKLVASHKICAFAISPIAAMLKLARVT